MGVLDYIKDNQSVSNIGSEGNLTASPDITSVDETTPTPSSMIGNQIAKYSYGLTHLNKDKNKYEDYDVHINPINTEEDLNLERAKNQSSFEQFMNSMGQILENEILLGIPLGFSNMIDWSINLIKKEPNDYTNPVSKFLEDVQDKNKERLAIYQENPGKSWQVGDFGWWTENLVSVGSTVSLMVPSMATAKGLSWLGKATKLTKVEKNILKGIANIGNRVDKGKRLLYRPAVAMKNINNLAESSIAAVTSRIGEGYMESRETYKTVYDKALKEISNLSAEEKEKLIERNPNYANMSDEEIAQDLASISGSNTFKEDMPLFFLDLLQYWSINRMFKGNPKAKTPTAQARLEHENAMRKLRGEAAKEITTTALIKESLRQGLKNPLDAIKSIPFTEGLEEGWQGIVQQRSEELYEMALDPKIRPTAISSYLKDGHIWEQAFWGIVGGAVFEGIAHTANSIKDEIDRVKNNKRLSDNNQKQKITNAKLQSESIKTRFSKMNEFVDKMKKLNEGHHYEKFAVDEKGKPIEDENGAYTYLPLSDVEILEEKEKLINELVDSLVLDSVDNGTYELIEEFIGTEYFEKFFVDAGMQKSDIDTYIKDRVQNRMKSTYDMYLENLDILNTIIDDPYGYSIQSTARQLTMAQIGIEQHDDVINHIDNQLRQENAIERLDDGSYDRQLLNVIHANIRHLDKQEQKYKEQYNQGKISKSAYNQYVKEISDYKNKVYKALENLKSKSQQFDDIKNKINELAKNANLEQANADYNQIIGELTDLLYANNPTVLTDSIRDLLIKRAEAELIKQLEVANLPVGEEAIKQAYAEIDYGITDYAFKKLKKAFDLVEKYIMEHNNPETAYNEIMSSDENLSQNLKDALEILKLGHTSTKVWHNGLQKVLQRALNKQAKDAQEAQRVHINGDEVNPEERDGVRGQIQGAINNGQTQQPTSPTGENAEAQGVIAQAGEAFAEEQKDATDKDAFQDPYLASMPRFRNEFSEIITNSKNKKEYIALIENIRSTEFTDPNFKALFENLVDELIKDHGLTEEVANNIVLEEIFNILQIFARKNRNNPTLSEKYADLARQIQYGFRLTEDNDMLSATSTIGNIDAELELINNIVQLYLEESNTKGQPLNVDDFFNTIIENDQINYQTAGIIYHYFNDYVQKYNIPVVNNEVYTSFRDNSFEYFNTLKQVKAQQVVVADYMHIAGTNIRAEGYEEALERALNGEKVDIVQSPNGKDQLLIKIGNIELGFISKTKATNSTKTKYRKNFNTAGLWWEIEKTDTGYKSNYDEFFEALMLEEDDNVKKLLNFLNQLDVYINSNIRQKALIISEINDGTKTDIEALLELIGKIRGGSEILNEYYRQSNLRTNAGKETFMRVLKDIKGVALFDSQVDKEISYQTWLQKVYDNYVQTAKITDLVENASEGNKIVTTIKGIGYQRPNYVETSVDVNSQPFVAEQHVVFGVDKNGNIVTERGNERFNSSTIFGAGTMGLLLANVNGNPFIARFTEANNLDIRSQLGQMVENHLIKILTDYQTNESYSLDHLYEDLLELLVLRKNKNDTNYNPLFTGYTLVKINGGIAIAKAPKYGTKVDKLQFVAAIYDRKYTNKEFANEAGQTRAITLFNENGQSYANFMNGQQVSFAVHNPQYIKSVAEDIVKGLQFNRSLLFVTNRNVDNVKTNKHFYKENGKLYIEFDGNRMEYDSYFQFIMKNNAFKVNVEAKNGKFTQKSDSSNSLYINVVSLEEAKDDYEAADPIINKEEALKMIQEATDENPANASVVLEKLGLGSHPINPWIANGLITDEIYYNEDETGDASFKDGKIYIRKRGINTIRKNPFEFIRLLAHENLHQRFDEANLFERDYVVNELLDTYNQFIKALEERVAQNDAQAIRIKNWIEENNFKPDNQFIKNDTNNVKFAEEWYVESITRTELANFLNSITYDGDITKGKNKSLLEKIIEVILNFLGFNFDNYNEISILAKQISISRDIDLHEVSPIEITQDGTASIKSPVGEEAYQHESEDYEDDYGDIGFEDFSNTTPIEVIENTDNFIEDSLNLFADNNTISPNGYVMVEDMNKFVDSFPPHIRPKIRQMIDDNRLKFICR